jgi:RNA polymerase sigma factor (sigma-70 family)
MTVIDISLPETARPEPHLRPGTVGPSAPFDRFYRERRRTMVGLACSMVDQQSVAEEIVQDAFHTTWQNWDRLDSPSGYLRKAVVSRCHDELRRRRVRRNYDRANRPESSPETDYLTDALSSIEDRRRKAVVLRYYGDRSLAEVADAMDIPTGTAKSLIHRGLADLRGALG